MIRRLTGVALAMTALALGLAARPAPTHAASIAPNAFKWPPWLSVEWPVNPYDQANRDALLLLHAAKHDGVPTTRDLAGTAEGMVNGTRRSVALHFDATSEPGVFALRRQWPASGAWLLRITLGNSTTALVALDKNGGVTSVDVPMQVGSGAPFPRPVGPREIDSALAVLAPRP
ncbi:MAG TPA: hypothetical protein VN607_04565 [Gemmatimonadaceae bacterium]|nr:hypothetical protein [Gemmatimonadaceae bacterium]